MSDLIDRLFGNYIALVAVWTIGPLILWTIRKRNKKKLDLEKRGNRPVSSPQAPPHDEVTRAGVMAMAAVERKEVVPGFRDVRWGESPKPEMTLNHSDGDEKLFIRPGDDLTMDGAPLKSIHYSYHRDRLQAVMIEMKIAQAEMVFKAICARWGMPKQPNLRQARFFWMDLLAGMDSTQAVFEKNHMAGKASFIISSKQMKEIRQREDTAAAG